MITKYFKSVVLRIPSVGHAAKTGRLFLSNLPPRSRPDIKVDFKLLDHTTNAAPELKVTYKDGTVVSADLAKVGTQEMIETFDRQSRRLQLQDTIKE